MITVTEKKDISGIIPVIFLSIVPAEEKKSHVLSIRFSFISFFITFYRFDPQLRAKRRRNIYKCHEGE